MRHVTHRARVVPRRVWDGACHVSRVCCLEVWAGTTGGPQGWEGRVKSLPGKAPMPPRAHISCARELEKGRLDDV